MHNSHGKQQELGCSPGEGEPGGEDSHMAHQAGLGKAMARHSPRVPEADKGLDKSF